MLPKFKRVTALFGVCLLCVFSGVEGAEPLRLRVSPAATLAPGFVTVRASIESDADNRLLQVVAVSPDFYRSSQIEMDGAQAPRLSVFEFRDLPPGDYEFSARLIGAHGPRATVSQSARVVPIGGTLR